MAHIFEGCFSRIVTDQHSWSLNWFRVEGLPLLESILCIGIDQQELKQFLERTRGSRCRV